MLRAVGGADATQAPPGHGSGEPGEDYTQPVLPGRGASDYERYLRTDELLELQKAPEEMAHRDELLFQTVHQSSELWLKLACFEVDEATRLVREPDVAGALRLLRRANECLKTVVSLLDMLEQMSPWEYTRWIRPVLGHGSGFDSPGFRRIRELSPELGQAFHELRRARGLDLVQLYRQGREHEELYQLAEALIEWDERVTLWRMRHYKVVARVIGAEVIGTQGTPVELLGNLIKNTLYPELWQARNELTEAAKEEE
jgi:tryptophan 2,3-dioxygenase